MIVLSSYSNSWCENNNTSSTGVEMQSDSLVLIPISELKLANIKMTELKYEKIINDSLRAIISNDDNIIRKYKDVVIENSNTINKLKYKVDKQNRQRNVAIGTTIAMIIAFLLK